MDGILETFVGQLRNAAPDKEYLVLERKDSEATVLVYDRDRDWTFLLLAAPNVGRGNGKWWLKGGEKAAAEYDGIGIFLGQSAEPGAVADCKGNRYKDDYRRLSYGKDARRDSDHPYVMSEIDSLFTEENLGRLLAGRPLVPRPRS